MTYLSKLILNPRDREVQRDLANVHHLHARLMLGFPYEPGLTGHARDHFGLLYRVDHDGRGSSVVLAQSKVEPDWTNLPAGFLLATPRCPEGYDVKSIADAWDPVAAGDTFIFRLRANPTKRIAQGNPNEPERWKGKRVPLRSEEEWLTWLERQGARCGFRLLTVGATADRTPGGTTSTALTADAETMGWVRREDMAAPTPVIDTRVNKELIVRGTKFDSRNGNERRQLTFAAVRFDGRLQVTDRDAFVATLEQGIGKAKAYGFGLLSIAPVAARAPVS